MRNAFILIAALGLSLTAYAAPRPATDEVEEKDAEEKKPKALYFLSNAPDNAVVSLGIKDDYSLAEGATSPTGGHGGYGLIAPDKTPAGPDALWSQGSIAVADDVSIPKKKSFSKATPILTNSQAPLRRQSRLQQRDLVRHQKIRAHETQISQRSQLPRRLPVSVATSAKHSKFCVVNSGRRNGVACGSFSRTTGLTLPDNLRPFGLNQTTPPTGPMNTPSRTLFSADEKQLLTTVKGDGAKNPGFLSVFAVDDDGNVGTNETRSSPKKTKFMFGATTIPDSSHLLITDPFIGAAIVDVDESGNATTVAVSHIPGQKAICWATYSNFTGTGFVTDTVTNLLVELNVESGKEVARAELKPGGAAPIDLVAVDKFVYTLNAGSAVIPPAVGVFRVGAGKIREVQAYVPPGVTLRAQGLAAYY